MSYINSLSQTLFLQGAIKSQNQQLTVLQQIISSGGQKAQNFSGFAPNVGALDLRVRGQLDRNSSYKDTISTLSTRTAAIENSLTSVDSEVNNLANTITQLNTQDPSGQAVQQTAQSTLDQVISQLNAQSDGVPLFAGVAQNSTNAPSFPIAGSAAVEGLLTSGVGGTLQTAALALGLNYPFGSGAGATPASAAADAQATIASIFNNTANTSTWFVPGAAGAPAAPAQIADDRSIQASVSANPSTPPNNPTGISIRDTLASVAAVATLTPADFANTADYDQFLVTSIGQLNTASTEINHAVAINGIVRGQLGTAQTVNDTSTNLLQQGLDTAEVQDVAQSITTLNNLQTQLQASYQVTAQLKGLSLANFLPA